jgi:GDP-L-fucose synthase
MYKEAKVLVTGGAGFIGVNLVRRLVDLGARVRATVHEAPPVFNDAHVEYVEADLRRSEDCVRVCQGVEYVFLCAAVTGGAAMMEGKPLFLLTPNVLMNIQMLEAAYEAGVKKLLFISSNTVYPVTDHPVREEEVTCEFFEKYFIAGWMKRFIEAACEMYSCKIKKPMATVVIRPANIYGPFDNFDWQSSHVLPALIRRVVERHDPIRIWGDGRDIKDLIYVDDLVEGLLLAMAKAEGFDVLNIGSGKRYVLRDVLDTIIRLDGYAGAKIEYDLSKPTMIPKRVLDVSKAKRVLGFEAKISMEEGLSRTIAWYRSTL